MKAITELAKGLGVQRRIYKNLLLPVHSHSFISN
jgi:hypothetical protein